MLQQALGATVAWVRLEKAMKAYELELRSKHGVTLLQLSVLTICAERPQLPLAALRKMLVMHPATLGQAIDEMRRLDLVSVRTDPKDKRARLVGLTEKGAALVAEAPVAGPLRLRGLESEAPRLDALKRGLEDALELFGLAPWSPKR
jgi:DNA-binding MarR family transcriptional regulator